jgi:hypothetical protein
VVRHRFHAGDIGSPPSQLMADWLIGCHAGLPCISMKTPWHERLSKAESHLAVGALLSAVTVAAAWMPARGAGRTHPAMVLRVE